MSPALQPVVLEDRRYTLRHVGPRAQVWPTSPAANVSWLARTDMVSREMPSSSIPNDPNFTQGSYNLRLMDAADGQFVFPNKEASDGVPWRIRFDPTFHLQWVEAYLDGDLEGVFCITKTDTERDHVEVNGYDGFYLTKTAYARDWIVVQAPRDVIERGTQLWVQVFQDNFPYNGGGLGVPWTVTSGAVTTRPRGGAILTGVGGTTVSMQTAAVGVASTLTWAATCTFSSVQMGTGGPPLGDSQVFLEITESSGDQYLVGISANASGQMYAVMTTPAGGSGQTSIPSAASYSIGIESDGEWVWGYVNGQFIGGSRRQHFGTLTMQTTIGALINTGSVNATVATVYVETLQPFLMRGSDKGDYVLPGGISTNTPGGLHARYYNNSDLGNDPDAVDKIHHPSRSQAYAGSGAPEYANQQDTAINGQQNPTPGAALSNWSAVWFGSIYLKMSAGSYSFSIVTPNGPLTAVRAWVGQTRFQDLLVNGFGAWTTNQTFAFTVSQAALAGNLGYGRGTVARDGWYPIKVEYAVQNTAGAAPVLKLTSSPAAYTDPGGTVIASGGQSTTVPSTSLSPLGMVDQRHQGVSHFDLAQKNAIAFGYQIACEPQRLESGLFPGVLAPRVREGIDTDAILEPDDSARAEGLAQYGNVLDAVDTATSMQGNGAGFQSGSGGQLQAYVYDIASLQASGGAPYNIQAWQDASDAAFASLLDQILNSELGLRLLPWQTIAATPHGKPRLALSWPLSGAVAAQRWRPGDGMRVRASDVNIWDTAPRQIWLITRQATAGGVSETTVGFAGLPNTVSPQANYGMGVVRPRSAQAQARKTIQAVSRWQRNYQRQLTTLTGVFVSGSLAAGAVGGLSVVLTLATDQVVRAWLRVSINTAAQPLLFGSNSVFSNAIQTSLTGATTGLAGPIPINLNFMPVAAPDATGQLYASVKNSGGIATVVNYQLLVDVLR